LEKPVSDQVISVFLSHKGKSRWEELITGL